MSAKTKKTADKFDWFEFTTELRRALFATDDHIVTLTAPTKISGDVLYEAVDEIQLELENVASGDYVKLSNCQKIVLALMHANSQPNTPLHIVQSKKGRK